MSADLQCVSIVDDLRLVSAQEIAGAQPRAIRLQGARGLSSTQRVLINSIEVDTFTLVSDTVLIVDVPDVLSDIDVAQMRFEVLSGEYTGTNPVRLLFGPTKRLRTVRGILKLVQVVLKVMLSNHGSHKFISGYGGGLLASLGHNLDMNGKAQISAAVARAVSVAEQQIQAGQSRARGLEASERLLSLTLDQIKIDPDRQEVQAIMRLTAYSGRSVQIPLAL